MDFCIITCSEADASCKWDCFCKNENSLQRAVLQSAPLLGAHPAPSLQHPLPPAWATPGPHLLPRGTGLCKHPPLISNLLLLWSYLWDLEPVCGPLDFVFVLGHLGVWTSDLPDCLLACLANACLSCLSWLEIHAP